MKKREQQDDHCWLTCGGLNWKIRGKRGDTIYVWRGYSPHLEYAIIDVSLLDTEEYCQKAWEMLQ